MNDEIDTEIEEKDAGSSERLYESRKQQRSKVQSNLHSAEPNQQFSSLFYGKPGSILSSASWLRDFVSGLCSSLKSQGNLSLVVIIIFFVILLMQARTNFTLEFFQKMTQEIPTFLHSLITH